MTTKYMLALATVALAMVASAATATAKPNGLSKARAATAGYHNNDTAVAAGYGQFTDLQGIACIDNLDNPGTGAMGIHFAKPELVFGNDSIATVKAATPEALVYEPTRNGGLRLVAAEYIVLQGPWDATHSSRPSLFGHEFGLITEPNRYGLPPFYELHAWMWKHNPSGMFEDWNPRVSCAWA
jgi:hypothetical protein